MALAAVDKWAAGGDTFTKAGMVHEDHHFKDGEGRYQRSPPAKMKGMYDYLPNETAAGSPKRIPQKVTLEATINGLVQQAHCLGVYLLVTDLRSGPVWKHATADLCLAASSIDGEEGWSIGKYTTHGVKERRCMQVACEGYPFGTALVWSAWSGRSWEEQPSIKCRPSFHGFGLTSITGDDNTWNAQGAPNSPPRRKSEAERAKRSSSSPPPAALT